MESRTYTTETRKNDIYLIPKKEKHTDTLIFMHGLGDTAAGWIDLFETDSNPCPASTKIVLLTAPTAAVSINNGMMMPSWYDIIDLNPSPGEFERAVSKDEVGKNAKRIEGVLEEEIKILNGDSKSVVIGGFSQGCAMALHVGLGFNKPLAGILGWSGYLFPFTNISKENESTPIFLSHGLDDPVIQFKKSEDSIKRLDATKHNLIRLQEKGLEHSINLRILQESAKFLRKVLKKA